MLSLRKRGRVYWLEGRIANRRIQTTLGTRNGDAATLAKNRVERALTEGASSQEWPLLQGLIPATVFLNLAAIVGHVTQPPTRPHTWVDLKAAFTAEAERRIVLAKLRASTWIRYKYTLSEFTAFLSSVGVSELAPISRVVIENFKAWRVARIKQKRHSREARGVALDAAILHRVFSYGLELEMIARNPVRMEGRPGDAPECGAQPFKADELSKLRAAAGLDFLAILVLRWTGLRGSDVVTLRWAEIDFHTGEISRLTLKRRKRVVVPMHSELKFALEADFQKRSPSPEDRVLLNPATSKPMTRPRLYARIVALGKRAGVADAHPHRFRDTFCVDMLARGVNPYNVAKLVGITVEMLERHYAPFIPELRERVRRALDSGEGLEGTEVGAADSPRKEAVIQ
jgi:integrase